ncbi:MAG: GDSL-type esterase/lipase family protein [candidate division KSB1 bacterium]|jgi:lysophospholipase L1-like esterase|nr:GDSL-type esterase/lipase family protein [candidate division KSB1 bacterium]
MSGTGIYSGKWSNCLNIALVIVFIFSLNANSSAQIKIMPLGNSITAGEAGSSPVGGFRDDLAFLLTDENVNFDLVGTFNDGVSTYPMHQGAPGKTAGYIANHLSPWLSDTSPDIVLLHIGTNDISSEYSISRIMDDIVEILDDIWDYDPNTPVLLCSVIPRQDTVDRNNQTTALSEEIHLLVIEQLQQGQPIRYVGQNEIFTENGDWGSDYMYDNLHPNNWGYSIMAEAYFNILMNELNGANRLITDNFNRSQLGYYTWKTDQHYIISTDKMTIDTGGNFWWKPAVYIAESNAIGATFTYGSDVNPVLDGNAGLALMLDDNSPSTTGYLVYKESETGRLKLFSLFNGSIDQMIAEMPGLQSTPMTGDEFRVGAYSDAQGHHFNCFLNDKFDGKLIDPDRVAGNASSLYSGVMLAGTENNIIDDFQLVHFKRDASSMFYVWGDNQQGLPNTSLFDSLVVEVTDEYGNPIANVPVNFDVTSGDAFIEEIPANTHVTFEAEDGAVTYPMQILQDAAASGGQYIEVPEEYPDDSMAKAEYVFNLTESGTYVVWGRVRSDGDTHDSFKIVMDNDPEIVWHISRKTNWTWDQVYIYGGDDPAQFELDAGIHTLTVKNREWGSKIDQIIITNNLAFDPNAALAKTNALFITNASGKAFAKVTLGSTIGPVEIQASSSSLQDVVTFNAAIIASTPAYLAKKSGDNQTAGVFQELDAPFEAEVTDDFGNPVSGVIVNFEVTSGNGQLSETQTNSNASGRAYSTLTLGPDLGLNTVSVSLPGYPSIPTVEFQATAIQTGYAIAGNVYYYSNSAPVNDVMLTITGDLNTTVLSDEGGNYQIGSLESGATLQITPGKTEFENNGNQLPLIYSAALIMRHVVRLDTLIGFHAEAADVDLNGQIQPYDAALVAHFAVGLNKTSDSHVGEWLFHPPYRQYFNLAANYYGQNYSTVLLGDVAGEWQQNNNMNKDQGFIELADHSAAAGDSLIFPLFIDQDEGMISCDAELIYDPDVLTCIGVHKTGITQKMQLVANLEDNGRVEFGLYGSDEINSAGEIVNVLFVVNAAAQVESIVNLSHYRLNDGPSRQATSVVSVESSDKPLTFTLGQNYPNPFNPETMIPYNLPAAGHVRLSLYNIMGQHITDIYNGFEEAGQHQYRWDGTDRAGQQIAGGIYLCRMVFGNESRTIKLIKLH